MHPKNKKTYWLQTVCVCVCVHSVLMCINLLKCKVSELWILKKCVSSCLKICWCFARKLCVTQHKFVWLTLSQSNKPPILLFLSRRFGEYTQNDTDVKNWYLYWANKNEKTCMFVRRLWKLFCTSSGGK